MGGPDLTALTLPAPAGRRLRRPANRGRAGSGQARAGVAFAALAATTAVLWLVAWAVVVPMVRGWTPTVVMSGSMAPAIDTGDVVVTVPYRPAEVGVGSVIVFDDPGSARTLVHRVVAVTPDGHYVTRGDANNVNDPTSIAPDLVLGTGKVLVPYVGLPVVWMVTGAWGHLLALVGVVTLLAWAARGVTGHRLSPAPVPAAARPAPPSHRTVSPVPPSHRALPPVTAVRSATVPVETPTPKAARLATEMLAATGRPTASPTRMAVPVVMAGSRLVGGPDADPATT